MGRQEGRGPTQPLAVCVFFGEDELETKLAKCGVCTDSGPWQRFSHQKQAVLFLFEKDYFLLFQLSPFQNFSVL